MARRSQDRLGSVRSATVSSALFLGLLGLSSALERGDERWAGLSVPAPVADGRIARNPHAAEIDCARCHAAIAGEWAQTLHALAWLSEPYQEEVADKQRPQGCWGCHVPQALHQSLDEAPPQKPAPREEHRNLGIDCNTCHLGPDGVILGPWGAPTDAHRSLQHANFVAAGTNALCTSCHATNIGPVLGVAKDFELGGQAAAGKTCVGCHMAPVERPAAVAAEGGAPSPVRTGRSHALQTPRDPSFLARAFDLTARADGARTLVRVGNAAGHRVPGMLGREFRFAAEVLAADGSVADRGELVIDHENHLPGDGALEIAVAARGSAVRVVGHHVDPRLEEPVEFLDRRLAIGEH